MWLEFRDSLTGCSLVVDEDGAVAYAYLRDPDDEIIGDVWLYNVAPTPDFIDFSRPPFLNAASLCSELDGPPPTSEADIDVRWSVDGELLMADVHVRGQLLARLTPGASPGWNVLALVDGPLAQRLI